MQFENLINEDLRLSEQHNLIGRMGRSEHMYFADRAPQISHAYHLKGVKAFNEIHLNVSPYAARNWQGL